MVLQGKDKLSRRLDWKCRLPANIRTTMRNWQPCMPFWHQGRTQRLRVWFQPASYWLSCTKAAICLGGGGGGMRSFTFYACAHPRTLKQCSCVISGSSQTRMITLFSWQFLSWDAWRQIENLIGGKTNSCIQGLIFRYRITPTVIASNWIIIRAMKSVCKWF